MDPTRLFLTFCPYLPLSRTATFGEWSIAPSSTFDSAWSNPEFEQAAKQFLSKFTDALGERLKDPALVVPARGGPNGVQPARVQHLALESAISIATIDHNYRWTPERQHHSWNQVTAENGDFFVWPIDVEQRYVTLVRGSPMMQTMSGGWKIDDEEFTVPGPVELHMPTGIVLDEDVLEAAYSVFLQANEGEATQAEQRRLLTAATWLTKTWRNTPSIDIPERIVFLKTGFEALTDTDKSREAAHRLRQLFETLSGDFIQDNDELLRSPDDRPIYQRANPRNGKAEILTPLEHWFMALADQRNEIVHGGVVGNLQYEKANSAFNGPFLWTGEWILRCAIKIKLGQLGFPGLWQNRTFRAALKAMRHAHGAEPKSGK